MRTIPFKAIALVLILMALFFTSSCEQEPDIIREFDNYNTRLSRVLDAEQPTIPITILTTYPKSKHKIDTHKITLLDFLRLFGCELQLTVGARNSQMGKVATDSQRLLNTLRFLDQAPICITELEENKKPKLAQKLREAIANKQTQLPQFIFNATLAGPEFGAMWQGKISKDYPYNTSTQVIDALEELNYLIDNWLNGYVNVGWNRLEDLLSIIRAADAGELLKALAISQNKLESANHIINSRLHQRPLCFNEQTNTKADIFKRVVLKFFINEIQQRQSSIHQRRHVLLPAIRNIEDKLAKASTISFLRWKEKRDQYLLIFSDTNTHHVKHIKALSNKCNLGLGG